LIVEGLREAGVPPDRIETVHSELDAVERAVSMLETNDVAIVLADDVRAVLERVRTMPSHA
jgi:hypothetical protein